MIADTQKLYKKILQYAPCFFIILVALCLRFYDVESSLWLDEVYSLERSGITGKIGSVSDLITYVAHNDAHPPCYYVLLRLWASVSYHPVWLKLLSMLFGIGAIAFAYLIVAKVADHYRASLCAITLACSYFLIHYSQNIRHYSLVNFLAIFSSWCIVQGVMTNKTRYFFIYAFATILGFYTYYYLAFLFATHGAILFFYGGIQQKLLYNIRTAKNTHSVFGNIYEQITHQVNFARWVKSQVVATVVFFPWLYYVLPLRLSLFAQVEVKERGSVTLANLYELLQDFLMGETQLYVAQYIFVGILILGCITLLFSDKKYLWLYSVILLPTIITVFFPFKGHVFQSKHLIYLLPLLLCIINVCCLNIRILSIFLFALICTNLYMLHSESHKQKQPWNTAINEVYRDIERGDVLCFNPYYLEVPAMYYYKRQGTLQGKEIVPAFVYLTPQQNIPRRLQPYIYFSEQHLQRVSKRNLWLIEIANCHSTPRNHAFFIWCEKLFKRVEQRSYQGSFGTIIVRRYTPRK
ncbi:glycosyltransferase family 39 protein [Candidatus Uabimicrobium amorphum]|uniref:Glycosyltransferase RgtA/B/C/D-like domain-containing protein n=1 Tax=Uabimicrobium amorphum TaxID=2596890 RepID=A0A5S9IJ22_UABAM|nr:glycosyltransferase family 39 protein [Candidatus Uabimicrobium amorphum]BBM81960.1 hypothetical protein UABAM_00303 [Candidatus Uabimicrobium amorphum]